MKERLRKIRELVGLSQTEFAEKLGLIFSTISKYERGVVKPSSDFLANIGQTFNVNLNWFLTGKGEIFNKEDSVVRESCPERNGDDKFNELKEVWSYLSDDRRDDVLYFCKKEQLLDRLLKEEEKKSVG